MANKKNKAKAIANKVPKPNTPARGGVRQNNQPRALKQEPLSMCASNYAQALLRPWSGPLACLPYPPSLPSVKYRTRQQLQFSNGTQVGFISVAPRLGAYNDEVSIFGSGGAYAAATFGASPTTGVNPYNMVSPYGTGDIFQVRLIAYSIRLQYVGAAINRAGRLTTIEHPIHASITGLTDGACQPLGAKVTAVDPVEKIVLWTGPKTSDDIEWYDEVSAGAGNFSLGAMVIGAGASNIAVFQVVLDGMYEAILTTQQTQKTASSADPAGASMVNNAAASAASAAADHPGFAAKFGEYLSAATQVAGGLANAYTSSKSAYDTGRAITSGGTAASRELIGTLARLLV